MSIEGPTQSDDGGEESYTRIYGADVWVDGNGQYRVHKHVDRGEAAPVNRES